MDTKTCKICRVEKPFSDFYKRRKNGSSQLTTGGVGSVQPYCKPCYQVIRRKDYNTERYKVRRREYMNRALGQRYGISYEEYLERKLSQNGECYICRKHYGEDLVLDHDHDTLINRKFLCRKCNMAVSVVEAPQYMEKLLRYVEEFRP
jgi:glycosyltransferase involved in cell wall biosynthesis